MARTLSGLLPSAVRHTFRKGVEETPQLSDPRVDTVAAEAEIAEAPKDPVMERDVARGIAAVRRILEATDAEIKSRAFILERLLEFGIFYNDWPMLSRYAGHMNSSLFGVVQLPSEFVDYLMEAGKHNIETVIEIGVYRGGSSYFAAAVLQRMSQNFRYTMVDIEDRLIAFDRFSELLHLDRRIPATSADFVDQQFDLVFIDADHSYDGAKVDYINVGKHARKLCVFHDIHGHEFDHLNGGIVRCWDEMRDALARTHRIVEYAHSPKRWMGIGLIQTPDASDR